MRIIKAKDYAEMSRKAANIIAAQVVAKPNCVLGLATGGTPVGTYKSLIEDWYKVGDLSFAEVTTVNLDEYRGLPRTNDQSYWYFMHENLFNQSAPTPSMSPTARTPTPRLPAPSTTPSSRLSAALTCSCWASATTVTSASTSPLTTSPWAPTASI